MIISIELLWIKSLSFIIFKFLLKFIANKRGVYDTHGFETLRSGIVDKSGAIKGAYKYGGNAYEIFEKFFGTTNPFSLIKDGIFFWIDISNYSNI